MPTDLAALYVEDGGVYFDLDGVDPWPAARDARTYGGPHPVIAHPPCARWAMPLAKVNQTRYGQRVGDDGGCFEAALRAVQRWGGVLEHPANTAAWAAFGLPKPQRGRWMRTPWEGWVCQVAQGAYGCPARKRTWLYAFGMASVPELNWSEPEPTMVTSWLQKTATQLPRLSKKHASRTSPAFRDLLIAIARSAHIGPD